MPLWAGALLQSRQDIFHLLVRSGLVNFSSLVMSGSPARAHAEEYRSHIQYILDYRLNENIKPESFEHRCRIKEAALKTLIDSGADMNLAWDISATGTIDPDRILHPLDVSGAYNLKLLDWLIENGLCDFTETKSIIHDLIIYNLPEDPYYTNCENIWQVPDYQNSTIFYRARAEHKNMQQVRENCDRVELRLVLLVQLGYFDTLRVDQENGEVVIGEWRRVVNNRFGEPESFEASWMSVLDSLANWRHNYSRSSKVKPKPFLGFLSWILSLYQGPKSLQDLARIAIRVTLGGVRFRVRAERLPIPPILIRFIIRSTLY